MTQSKRCARAAALVTFTSKPLVWFDIRGKSQGGDHRILRDDKHIIQGFMKWLCDQTFFPTRMQMTGGGRWLGAFWPEDAEFVKQWLEARGASEVVEHPTVKR